MFVKKLKGHLAWVWKFTQTQESSIVGQVAEWNTEWDKDKGAKKKTNWRKAVNQAAVRFMYKREE